MGQKKFTPCLSTYIILCTLIGIWPIIFGMFAILEPDYKGHSFGYIFEIVGVLLIAGIAFAISRYNVIVNYDVVICKTILKKTTICKSDIHKVKLEIQAGNKGFSPVFSIYTTYKTKPSMVIRIKHFSKSDVVEMADVLGVEDFNYFTFHLKKKQ